MQTGFIRAEEKVIRAILTGSNSRTVLASQLNDLIGGLKMDTDT